jgi:hypothetical protein
MRALHTSVEQCVCVCGSRKIMRLYWKEKSVNKRGILNVPHRGVHATIAYHQLRGGHLCKSRRLARVES